MKVFRFICGESLLKITKVYLLIFGDFFDILLLRYSVGKLCDIAHTNIPYSRSEEMTKIDVTITNNIGLHARPATFFIQKANSYKSLVWIEKDDRKINAKSLLGVLSLGIAKGMTVTLIADGVDERAAVSGLSDLINTGFAEFE